MTFIQSVRTEQFDKVDFTFFASDADCTRQNWKQVEGRQRDRRSLICAGRGAGLRWFARLGSSASWARRSPRNCSPAQWWRRSRCGCPRPAVLRVKAAVPVKRAVATVFVPASEHGQKGMDELHEQTVNLLSFQQLPKDDLRRAGRVQPGLALWREVCLHAVICQRSHSEALQENYRRIRRQFRRCSSCRRQFSTGTHFTQSAIGKRRRYRADFAGSRRRTHFV